MEMDNKCAICKKEITETTPCYGENKGVIYACYECRTKQGLKIISAKEMGWEK